MTKKIETDIKPSLFKKKTFWTILFLTIYALFGIVYAPTIIKRELISQLNQQLNAETVIEKISFNPFSFATRINKLSLNDLQGENWITSENIKLDFDPFRLIFGDWVFSEILIEQPVIKIEILADGKLRFPQLPESNAGSTDISLILANINIDGGKLQWIDRSIHEDFTLNIKHLSFNQLNFKNTDHDSGISLKIITHNDETLELSGFYNHGKQSFNSDLILSNWKSTTLNEFIPKHLLFQSKQGSLQALGKINWKLSEKPQFEFSQITTNNMSFEINSQPQFDDTNVLLENIKIDLNNNQLSIERLFSEQANFYYELSTVQSTDQTIANEKTDSWQVNIESIETRGALLYLSDKSLNAVNTLELERLNISQFNLGEQPIDAQITIKTPVNGQIDVNAQFIISSLELKADIDATSIDLASWSTWVESMTNLRIKQGQFTGAQKLIVGANSIESSGNLQIEQLQLNNLDDQEIVSFKQLQVLQSQVNSADKTLFIDKITLDEAVGVISIDEEGSINLKNIVDNKAADKTEESGDWQIKIGQIDFENGSTQLIDKSIEPSVNNSITKINGSIKELSSDDLNKADITLNGLINQFSKLEIKGKINPLSSEAYTDLDIAVTDLDLHHFSSYAATYIAYPVTGGKLDLKMNYKLNKNKLEGKNYFYLQQLNLGSKNNSSEAVKLPIKMAMTLLSDSKGNIKINLPVSGNINDPEFSYGSLVGKAILKLITSMVASPFKVLGLLIPNADPQMNQIRFLEGQHNIDPTEEHKFDQITAILEKKPKLKLQLTPILNDITDTQALKQQLMLEKIKLSELDFSNIQLKSWIEQQLPDSSGIEINYPEAWETLLNQQILPEGQLLELSHKRTENIKLRLINKYNIPAEHIFVNSAKHTSETIPMIEIGVTQ